MELLRWLLQEEIHNLLLTIRLERSLSAPISFQVVGLRQRTDYSLFTFETDNDNNTSVYTYTRMIMNLILVVLTSKLLWDSTVQKAAQTLFHLANTERVA
jgi:hypothetical protein